MPRPPQEPEFNGALLIDKPAGPTSHDIVDIVRLLYGIKKVGHCGTLDPAATGLLILLLGLGCGKKVVIGTPVVVYPAYGVPYYYYPALPGPPFTRVQLRQPGLFISAN